MKKEASAAFVGDFDLSEDALGMSEDEDDFDRQLGLYTDKSR